MTTLIPVQLPAWIQIRLHPSVLIFNGVVKFKIKLAMCLARITDEERAAGLEDPWIGKQRPMKFPDPNPKQQKS